MAIANLIRVTLLTFPWVTLVFLPKRSIQEFLPVSFIASILVAGISAMAVRYKWWIVDGGWKSRVFNDTSFILGPFFVGTLWIFHISFGNFKRYFLVNLIMDLMFSYPLNYLFQRFKLYRLVNFTPRKIFLFFISFSFIIYGSQLMLKRLKWSD